MVRDYFKPCYILILMLVNSALALAAAFSSEAFLGLEPCPLCIYQRWPYAVVIIIAVIGLFLRKNIIAARSALGACALAFLINSGIAFYHTGVELKWWKSEVEGCSVQFTSDEPQSILENIMSAPTGRCDEIPWADPILGLSMANYNVALCLGLAMICFAGLLISVRKPSA